MVQLGNVQGDTFAGVAFGGVLAVNLHAADVARRSGGHEMKFVAGADPAMGGNAGDNRAGAANGERILDPQAERPGARTVAARVHGPVERLEKIVETFASNIGNGTNRRTGQKCLGEQTA